MCACQFAAPWLRKPLYFQAGRFLAYTAGGALAGGISSGVLGMASNGIQVFQALNWMLMSVLAFSAVLLLWRGQSLGVPFPSPGQQGILISTWLTAPKRI